MSALPDAYRMIGAADFTIGIEEEHLLVEPGSGALAVEPPEALLQECSGLMGGQINPEFLNCQIEVSTRVCGSLQVVRADLVGLRKAVSDVAARHGLAPIAASTHPFGRWSELGRASCRERGCVDGWLWVGAGTLKKTQ